MKDLYNPPKERIWNNHMSLQSSLYKFQFIMSVLSKRWLTKKNQSLSEEYDLIIIKQIQMIWIIRGDHLSVESNEYVYVHQNARKYYNYSLQTDMHICDSLPITRTMKCCGSGSCRIDLARYLNTSWMFLTVTPMRIDYDISENKLKDL